MTEEAEIEHKYEAKFTQEVELGYYVLGYYGHRKISSSVFYLLPSMVIEVTCFTSLTSLYFLGF